MSKTCYNCGTELDDDAGFCTFCGEKQNTGAVPGAAQNNPNPYTIPGQIPGQAPYGQPYGYNPYAYMAAPMSEKQFYDMYASSSVKGWAIAAVVVAFLTAAVSLIYIFLGNVFAVMDIAFYALVGIMILATKKWGAALAMALYGGFFSTLNLLLSGAMPGIIAIFIAIMAAISLKKVNNEYKLYRMTGQLPMMPIK